MKGMFDSKQAGGALSLLATAMLIFLTGPTVRADPSPSPSSPSASSPATGGTASPSSQAGQPGSTPAVADATAPTATATPAQPSAPTPLPDLLIPSANIHFKGFIDTYAQYNPTDASYSNFRAYDFGANSFNLNMAQLKFWRPDDDGVGFVLRTDFGPGAMASGQNFYPGFFGTRGTSNGTTGTMPWSMFWLEEAYVNLWIPVPVMNPFRS